MPRRTLPRNSNQGRPKSVNGISTHRAPSTPTRPPAHTHTHTPKPIHIWHGSRVATRNFYVLRIKRNDLKLKRLRPHGFRTVRNSLSIDRQRTVNGFIGTRWQFNMSLCRWKQKRKSKSEKKKHERWMHTFLHKILWNDGGGTCRQYNFLRFRCDSFDTTNVYRAMVF